MDGMCFDYDHYFSEETFIIDDFGEICEDVVRIASANTQYFCKDFDAELRQESPPPGSFIASNRCFDKEVSSLFSEMEYLTEVSPGTDVVLADTSAITIAVNPTEFSCKRSQRCTDEASKVSTETEPQNSTTDVTVPIVETLAADKPQPVQTYANVSAPLEYQRILNNYIQKGRRKLEASSYSKMKSSCLARERLKASACSTSTIATVSTPTQPSTGPGGQFKLCHNTSTTANNLPPAMCNAAFDKHASISDCKRIELIRSSSSTCPTLHQSAPLNRTATTTGLLKTARLHHCRDCSSSFSSSELLRKHSCIIAEQYQCHLCLREFKKRKTLDHHMKSHEKVFSTDDDLRK